MASGTTYFDNTVGVDAIVPYTSGGAVTLPTNVTVTYATITNGTITTETVTNSTITNGTITNATLTTVTATTFNAAANTGTVAAAQPGTTLTAAGTFAPTFASGYIQMNAAAGTDLAFVLTTTGLKVGGIYTAINRTAPTAGTYTLTASAGTFYVGQDSGTVLKFASGKQALTFQVLSSTIFQVLANAGTVAYA